MAIAIAITKGILTGFIVRSGEAHSFAAMNKQLDPRLYRLAWFVGQKSKTQH
jgi:hypothetical protein